MLTRAKILKEINDKHLTLYKGDGYYYFAYGAMTLGGREIYETSSVYVNKLNDMDLASWVADGRDFVAQMKAKHVL